MATNNPDSSSSGSSKKLYSAVASYNNKTDKTDAASFLDHKGNPDKQASEYDSTAEEDPMDISEEEEFERMETLAKGAQAAIIESDRQLYPYVPLEVHSIDLQAYAWIDRYWKEGLTDRVKQGFRDVDDKIVDYNQKKERPDTEWKFPHREIIGTFDIYGKLFSKMKNAPRDRREELVRTFLNGNKMFIRGLAQRGIRFRDIVTPQVWDAVAPVLMQWGGQEDFEESLSPYLEPDAFQSKIHRRAKEIVADFFQSLQDKEVDQAEKELSELMGINEQLKAENLKHNYREDDHLLPLQEFWELLAAARNSKNRTPEKDILIRHASSAKGKFQLMGFRHNGIPSQFQPGPNFATEHKDFVRRLLGNPVERKLLEYPTRDKGKARESVEEPQQIAGSSKVKGLLPPAEGSDRAADNLEEILRNPKIAQLIASGAIVLPSQPKVQQQTSANPQDKTGESSQSAEQHSAAPSSPERVGESTQSPIPVEIKQENASDIDMDARSVSSDSDDEGTLMIHPGLKDGITLLGKVMFVRPVGRGAYRVFLNAGTDNKPFMIVRNGADFPRGFAEEWFQNPRFRSESDKPKGWKAEVFMSLDFIQTESSGEGAKRAPPAYIYGFENNKPALWTKTEFIMRCGKSGAMEEIQKRLARRKARQGVLADARSRRVHPDTDMPLTSSDRESMPWLFHDNSVFSNSSSSRGSRFTKIISSDDDEDIQESPVVTRKPNATASTQSSGKRVSPVPMDSANNSIKRESPASDDIVTLSNQVNMLTQLVLGLTEQMKAMKSP